MGFDCRREVETTEGEDIPSDVTTHFAACLILERSDCPFVSFDGPKYEDDIPPSKVESTAIGREVVCERLPTGKIVFDVLLQDTVCAKLFSDSW